MVCGPSGGARADSRGGMACTGSGTRIRRWALRVAVADRGLVSASRPWRSDAEGDTLPGASRGPSGGAWRHSASGPFGWHVVLCSVRTFSGAWACRTSPAILRTLAGSPPPDDLYFHVFIFNGVRFLYVLHLFRTKTKVDSAEVKSAKLNSADER